jgi:hypothetical protein
MFRAFAQRSLDVVFCTVLVIDVDAVPHEEFVL